MKDNNLLTCWYCTSEFEANIASFCSHLDATLICPFCLRCACDAPQDYKDEFLRNCPNEVLAKKLIMESKTSLKLGEILIRAGKITKAHLIDAIQQQMEINQKIGQIFINMNLLSQQELNLYLMEQKGIDSINLKNYEVDMDLVEKIGKSFCLSHKIIPVEIYQIGSKNIFRFIVSSVDDIPNLKKSPHLKDYTLIPYTGQPGEISRILREISAYDVLTLE